MSGSGAVLRARVVWWPWLFFGVFIASAAISLVLVADNGESLVEQAPFVLAFGMFGAVGALILSRARNRIGALLLYGSATTAISFLAGEVMTAMVRRGTTSGALVVAMGLLANFGWIIGILPVLMFLPLLFPDGRLPSRRWMPLAVLIVAMLGFLGLAIALGEARLSGSAQDVTIPNPFFVEAFGDVEISDLVFNLILLGGLGGSVVSLVLRFRRSRGVERQQIKWVAASLVFVVVSLIVSSIAAALGAGVWVDTVVSAAAFLSIPLAIGVGVLQYRLYDLDVVVKKALIAGALAVVVIGVYAGLVAMLGTVASEGENSASLFVIALALGIAFRPVTRFARRVADRLVYGRRATPYEVLTEFSERVGDAYATDDVLGRMAQILGQGVGAEGARVWLAVGRELRPASSWPPDAPHPEALRFDGEAVPDIDGEVAVEVRDRGELLGALSVTMPANDPMTPAKDKLVRDLASQAGLALRNVRLVEELKASQRRIVAAQDQERRRIERNIHDGAQQQLVALTVKMRLAQSLATRDAEKTAAMLEQMQAETQAALEDLRDLARGIYPPLLADQGLGAAIDAQVRKAGLIAEVSADGVRRYPQEVEGAVYFSVLEALQNVSKYAGAERVGVDLRDDGRELGFEVRDDGRGFDPAETRHGTGLQGIADRLSALGGEVIVRSRPGEGTVVFGRIPIVGPGVVPEPSGNGSSAGAAASVPSPVSSGAAS